MILTGKEDLRVQKTITAIRDALKSLILDKDIDDIQVTELCRRAKISKKTFYAYYGCLDDLFREETAIITKGMLNAYRGMRVPEDLERINAAFFKYAAGLDSASKKLLCHVHYDEFAREAIDSTIEKVWAGAELQHLSAFERRFLMRFLRMVGLACFREWVTEGCKTPIEEVIAFSGKLLTGSIQAVWNLGRRNSSFKPSQDFA